MFQKCSSKQAILQLSKATQHLNNTIENVVNSYSSVQCNFPKQYQLAYQQSMNSTLTKVRNNPYLYLSILLLRGQLNVLTTWCRNLISSL